MIHLIQKIVIASYYKRKDAEEVLEILEDDDGPESTVTYELEGDEE